MRRPLRDRPAVRLALLLPLVLLLGVSAPAAAQNGPACAALDAHGTLPLSCVDQRPRLDSAAIAFVQWLLLRQGGRWAGFEGSFLLAFTVDTTGKPMRHTVRVLHADSGRFAQQYPRIVVSEIQYSPAIRDGVRVPVEFQQRFEYAHPGDRGGDIAVAPLLVQVRESADPRGSTLRLEWVPVASSPLPPLDDDRSRARQMDALAVVLADSRWDAAAFACVTLLSGDRSVRAAPDEVERLRTVRQRVASPGECPTTYGGGMVTRNEDGTERKRPPGAGPDPYIVDVTRVVPWTHDWVVLEVTVDHLASTETIRCVQHHPAAGSWSTRCERTRWSVF